MSPELAAPCPVPKAIDSEEDASGRNADRLAAFVGVPGREMEAIGTGVAAREAEGVAPRDKLGVLRVNELGRESDDGRSGVAGMDQPKSEARTAASHGWGVGSVASGKVKFAMVCLSELSWVAERGCLTCTLAKGMLRATALDLMARTMVWGDCRGIR